MAGRKPLELAHVDELDGSDRAKQRMRVILETLQGVLTVPDACQRLGIHESRFHDLRHRWLQEALLLLEPRPVGRPANRDRSEQRSPQVAQLEAEAARLREELRGAKVREEIAHILNADTGQSGLEKKANRPPPATVRPR